MKRWKQSDQIRKCSFIKKYDLKQALKRTLTLTALFPQAGHSKALSPVAADLNLASEEDHCQRFSKDRVVDGGLKCLKYIQEPGHGEPWE